MKKIIISGAGGFVGGELTRKFVDHNIEVVAISQYFNEGFPESPLITKINLKIESLDSLLSAIPACEYDAFYHLAWIGINGPEKADSLVQVENIRMTLICAQAARKLSCKKFLCSGTIAERAVESLHRLDKTSGGMTYSIAKYCAHQMLENYCKNVGLPFVWMQFSNIYGPKNKTGNLVSYTLAQLSSGNEATFGPAQQPYDFVYVDDIIEAVYRLGVHNTKKDCYFIGSGAPRILREYLLRIGEIYGRKDLIKIGERADDHITYSFAMFDTKDLTDDIGEYVTASFDDHIEYTIRNY